MKELDLDYEIKRSCRKIQNLLEQAEQIKEKMRKMEEQLKQLDTGANKEISRITSFGYKTERRDGNPETSDELLKKREYNQNLYKRKLELVKEYYPDFYSKFENLVPDVLKEENLGRNEVS